MEAADRGIPKNISLRQKTQQVAICSAEGKSGMSLGSSFMCSLINHTNNTDKKSRRGLATISPPTMNVTRKRGPCRKREDKVGVPIALLYGADPVITVYIVSYHPLERQTSKSSENHEELPGIKAATLARIRTISCLERLASSQSDRKMLFFLSKRLSGVSNSATRPPSITKIRS